MLDARMAVLSTVSCVWFLLLFANFAASGELAFISPNFTSLSGSSGGVPYFTIGEYIGVSWLSSYEETSLTLYERGDDGEWIFDTLAGLS